MRISTSSKATGLLVLMCLQVRLRRAGHGAARSCGSTGARKQRKGLQQRPERRRSSYGAIARPQARSGGRSGRASPAAALLARPPTLRAACCLPQYTFAAVDVSLCSGEQIQRPGRPPVEAGLLLMLLLRAPGPRQQPAAPASSHSSAQRPHTHSPCPDAPCRPRAVLPRQGQVRQRAQVVPRELHARQGCVRQGCVSSWQTAGAAAAAAARALHGQRLPPPARRATPAAAQVCAQGGAALPPGHQPWC